MSHDRAMAMAVVLLAAAAIGGCKHGYFAGPEIGHGPDEYEIYTDRTPHAVHKGEQTARAGVMMLAPLQPLVRTPQRQKEVLSTLHQFYEKLYAQDERRAKDSVRWLRAFLADHRGLAPDQPVAIQGHLDTLLRAKERGTRAMTDVANESSKANLQEQLTEIDKEIEFFKKYAQERPAKLAMYQAHVDAVEAANKRMQLWESRHTRMANTLKWVGQTGGSADAELNRAMREMSELMGTSDEQTLMEVVAMSANIGGSDSRQLLPHIRAVAADTDTRPEIRAFAAKAAEAIESRGG